MTVAAPPSRPRADRLYDFLWRVHRAAPAAGELAIFNRFEQLLTDSSVVVAKFFLYISKDEQRRRFEERLRDPTKQWKLSLSDVEDRKHWDDYVTAYEEALTRCSTPDAPWFIVPADKRWFRNFALSHILVETLEALDMRFPKPTVDLSRIKLD